MTGKLIFVLALMSIAALVGESEAGILPYPYPHHPFPQPFPGYPPYPGPYPPMPFPFPRPHPGGCACPMVVDPVCGIDGRTYGNNCELWCQGMIKAHDGPCYFTHYMG